MNCPDSHKHSVTSTCYHTHGCRCDECRTAAVKRERDRYRAQAYGRYQGFTPVTGVIRRIQALHFMGWTTDDIAEASGLGRGHISHLKHRKNVSPATFAGMDVAYRTLVKRGRGPSARTAKIARNKGWASPYAWEDVDSDETPNVGTNGRLMGEELITEIDWLVGAGVAPHEIAANLGKTRDNLERFAWRHQRSDLATYLRERTAA
jgi:hypothetical protein